MEVRSGEVVPLGRVRVATVVQVALDDRDERRVTEESLEHAGEERGEARDAGREDEPAGLEHPTRLDERREPVGALGQVIERAQEQHGVHARVGLVEPARVADARAGDRVVRLTRRGPARVLDVLREGVHQVDLVAERREPARVHAGAPAHVEHDLPCGREPVQDELLGAREFDLPVAAEEAARLSARRVVREDLGRKGLGVHRPA